MAAHFSIPSSFLLPSFRHTSGVFINFHASPRADAVHDLGLNGGSIGRSQVGQLPYNKFLIPELHWIPNDTRSSFTPFRAGTCFSAAATTVLSLSLSPLVSSGAAVVRARVPTLRFPAEKKKRRGKKREGKKKMEEENEEQKEDLATLRTKTRPWTRAGIPYPSLHETVQRLFRTVALGLDGNQGHRELLHRDLKGRIEDRTWFSVLNDLLKKIFLEGSCCSMKVTESRCGKDIQYTVEIIVVIKIRAILLLLLAFRCNDKGFADQV